MTYNPSTYEITYNNSINYLSCLFPNVSTQVNIGTLTTGLITTSNNILNYTLSNPLIGSIKYDQFDITNLTNRIYKFTVSFTFDNRSGVADTGFYIIVIENAVYVTPTTSYTGRIIETGDSNSNNSYGNVSCSFIRNYVTSVPGQLTILIGNDNLNRYGAPGGSQIVITELR